MAKTKNPELEERRKAQVMETVQKLLTESSFHAMTMDKVADATGVSKGLINYYFKSKDDLIIETIMAYHERERQALLAIAENTTMTTRERLELLVAAVFSSREAVVEEMRFQTEVRSFSKRRSEVWGAVGASYNNFRIACEAMVLRGQEEGYLEKRAESEVKWDYLMLHALVNGLILQVAFDESIDIEAMRSRLVGKIEALLGATGA